MTYPVGLSRDLPVKRAMRAEVAGKDLVVWRNSNGALAAWDNRCPHRGMRLSHGFVRGDNLACLYHGWQFNAEGQCAYIPAHPDLEPPSTIRTVAYSVAEAGEVIWVALEGAATPPDLDPASEPLRSLTASCSKEDIRSAAAATEMPGRRHLETAPARFDFGAFSTVLLFNSLASTTLVHVLISGVATRAEKKHLSRWCEAWRRRAEATAKVAA